jgi:hypothetical protein
VIWFKRVQHYYRYLYLAAAGSNEGVRETIQ